MRHVRMLGLCLVAVFALAAVAATSASAGLPEWGQCYAKEGGKYANAGCTEKAKKGTGTFEWRKGTQVTESRKFHGVGGTGVLTGFYEFCKRGNLAPNPDCYNEETKTYEEKEENFGPIGVECEKETAVGEASGSKEVSKVSVKFVGCKLAGSSPCSNSSVEGEINVNLLKGKLGYISKAKKEVGVLLEPAVKKGEFAKFVCSGFIATVVGVDANTKTEGGPVYTGSGHDGIISPITPVNTMTKEETQVYTINENEENIPSKFEGKPLDLLESYIYNNEQPEYRSSWSRAGETITNVNTSETEAEIKA